MAPDVMLGGTRSSHRWAHPPGGMDRLNTRALFPTSNRWGIPDLPAAAIAPGELARLVPYTARHQIADAVAAGTADQIAIHFFLDDYRFETVWTQPARPLSRLAHAGAVLTPDFSLWTDMPPVMQAWQVYRSRWCGAWLAHHAIPVIPTVSWSTPDSWPYAFAGLPTGATLAVSTVGVHRDPHARTLWRAGYQAMVEQLTPTRILIHGQPLPPDPDGDPEVAGPGAATTTPTPSVRYYPHRWQHHRPTRTGH